MAVKLAYNRNEQFSNGTGVPYSGAKLFTYAGGSVNTKQTTYTESTGSTPNTNPIVLDSSGQLPQPLWLTTGLSYKFVLAPSTDTDPPTSPIWTLDRITGINDSSASQSEWVAGPTPTFVSATSFTLVGDQTSTFTVGRRTKTTNTSGTIYSTITGSAFGVLTTITVVNDASVLDSGLSAVSYGILAATNPSEPDIYDDSDGIVVTLPAGRPTFRGVSQVAGGRLTLTTAVPVTTSDVTGATTVFYTPYLSNEIMIHDGTNWVPIIFSEVSQTTADNTKSPAAVANTSNYDMFFWVDSGTNRCTRGPLWTSDTVRGTGAGTTELELFEGRLVNKVAITNGPAARRGLYVGSIRSDGSAQINDSLAKRNTWNYYNHVERLMQVLEATDSWAYTTATYQQANASAANQLDYIQGVSEHPVSADVMVSVANSSAGVAVAVGIGVDSSTVNSAQRLSGFVTNVVNLRVTPTASYRGWPGIGRHTLRWIEKSAATGASTWSGDAGDNTFVQSGITGVVRG